MPFLSLPGFSCLYRKQVDNGMCRIFYQRIAFQHVKSFHALIDVLLITNLISLDISHTLSRY